MQSSQARAHSPGHLIGQAVTPWSLFCPHPPRARHQATRDSPYAPEAPETMQTNPALPVPSHGTPVKAFASTRTAPDSLGVLADAGASGRSRSLLLGTESHTVFSLAIVPSSVGLALPQISIICCILRQDVDREVVPIWETFRKDARAHTLGLCAWSRRFHGRGAHGSPDCG